MRCMIRLVTDRLDAAEEFAAFDVSLEDANATIMAARAHWFDGEDKK